MKKGLIVYFTTTGNTLLLAQALRDGFVESGLPIDLKDVEDATVEEIDGLDFLCLGCSASGTEELNDTDFEPYFEQILDKLPNIPVFLFGCYGWGNGEFMQTWEKRVVEAKGSFVHPSFIQLETPKEEDLLKIKEIAKTISSNE